MRLLPQGSQLPQVGPLDLVQPLLGQGEPKFLQVLEVLNHLGGQLHVLVPQGQQLLHNGVSTLEPTELHFPPVHGHPGHYDL